MHLNKILPIVFLFFLGENLSQVPCPILPTPSTYVPSEGFMEVSGKLAINEGGIPEPIREFLIKKCINELHLITVFTPVAVQLVFKKLYNVPKDHYSIRIDKGITIQYSSEESCFYALISLFQLIEKQDGKYLLPRCFVSDEPKYEWRGLHLDASRHFFTIDEVKRYIDLMAQYKFNRFQWQLTGDQGWRIEIKKYPKLTGAVTYSDSTLNGHNSSTPRTYTAENYGGFYTQDQIREVIAYAAERYITIVPEIEIPGNSSAALAAYPEYSCAGQLSSIDGLRGVFDGILCMHESTLNFVKEVLDDIVTLFPSSYIHLGDDEMPKTQLKTCAQCQSVIQLNGLKNEEELQSWFNEKINEYLIAKGKKLMIPEEMRDNSFSANRVIISCNGFERGIEAAKQGYYVVMSPRAYCAFDRYQSKDVSEPLALGGVIPIEKVYDFNPVPSGTSTDASAYILGGQANVCTAYISDMKQLEHMVFPRSIALSQALWCQNKPTFEHFSSSLVNYHFQLLEDQKVNFSRALFYPEMQLFKKENGVEVVFRTAHSTEKMELKISEGKNVIEKRMVSSFDTLYLERTKGNEEKTLTYSLTPLNAGKTFTYELTAHSCLSMPLKLLTDPIQPYSAESSFTLTNGVRGNLPLNENDWLTFDKGIIVIQVDLERLTHVSGFKIGFLREETSFTGYPQNIRVFVSKNTRKWKEVKNFESQSTICRNTIYSFKEKSRYVKLEIKAATLPQEVSGVEHIARTSIDELIVYSNDEN
jgi:hexosaminidase